MAQCQEVRGEAQVLIGGGEEALSAKAPGERGWHVFWLLRRDLGRDGLSEKRRGAGGGVHATGGHAFLCDADDHRGVCAAHAGVAGVAAVCGVGT